MKFEDRIRDCSTLVFWKWILNNSSRLFSSCLFFLHVYAWKILNFCTLHYFNFYEVTLNKYLGSNDDEGWDSSYNKINLWIDWSHRFSLFPDCFEYMSAATQNPYTKIWNSEFWLQILNTIIFRNSAIFI